ncbi:MAG: 6,7-dimethyl-8-ribityllumazine synthase [Alphaproteobacteria bacterium]|nr:6,7-dimethyl-8-ribityllumazine synthase [Alphaproteobacteria bacterium]
MNQRTDSQSSQTSQKRPAIAAIRARWHAGIVDRAHDAFVAAAAGNGVPRDSIQTYDVPGAFEIPLLAQRLLRSGQADAVVAFALVVDGGIYRHDFVASSVIDGLMRVQLDEGAPVLSVVLTPHHFHEHGDHVDFFAEHFVTKGREAAAALHAVLGLEGCSQAA